LIYRDKDENECCRIEDKLYFTERYKPFETELQVAYFKLLSEEEYFSKKKSNEALLKHIKAITPPGLVVLSLSIFSYATIGSAQPDWVREKFAENLPNNSFVLSTSSVILENSNQEEINNLFRSIANTNNLSRVSSAVKKLKNLGHSLDLSSGSNILDKSELRNL
jgi:hypothetical protein